MKSLIDDEYLNKLNEQSKNSRISRKYQLMGLLIADLLNDKAHKALYIKLAKEYDPPSGGEKLLAWAKDVSTRKIERKGAYFMGILKREGVLSNKKKKATN